MREHYDFDAAERAIGLGIPRFAEGWCGGPGMAFHVRLRGRGAEVLTS